MKSKIYDCFIFFNELDILEIRLNELDKYVDYFVLVESRKTFTFQEKPLYFEENKDRFEKFQDKIIHVKMDFGGRGEWGNEFAQRDSIRPGLEGRAEPDDIILLSDVDEIPNLSVINLRDIFSNGAGVMGFEHQYYYYYLNCKMSLKQVITKAFKYSSLENKSPQEMRGAECDYVSNIKSWHFSYMGGIERIQEKLSAFSHQDMNLPEFNNEDHLRARLERNEDLFNRGYGFEIVGLEELPEYVRQNKEKFKHLLK